jgi:hypothetical protein
MLREIANRIRGMRKSLDVSLDFPTLLVLLDKTKTKAKDIKVYLETYGDGKTFRNETLEHFAEILEMEYMPIGGRYFQARHQVFKAGSIERHYIDVAADFDKPGRWLKWRNPFNRANLSYTL